jgi:hypothetical protein
MPDEWSTIPWTSAQTFPTYSRVALIDCHDQLAQVQDLANLTSVLFVFGMRLGQLACRPRMIKYHQTLICGRFLSVWLYPALSRYHFDADFGISIGLNIF